MDSKQDKNSTKQPLLGDKKEQQIEISEKDKKVEANSKDNKKEDAKKPEKKEVELLNFDIRSGSY